MCKVIQIRRVPQPGGAAAAPLPPTSRRELLGSPTGNTLDSITKTVDASKQQPPLSRTMQAVPSMQEDVGGSQCEVTLSAPPKPPQHTEIKLKRPPIASKLAKRDVSGRPARAADPQYATLIEPSQDWDSGADGFDEFIDQQLNSAETTVPSISKAAIRNVEVPTQATART